MCAQAVNEPGATDRQPPACARGPRSPTLWPARALPRWLPTIITCLPASGGFALCSSSARLWPSPRPRRPATGSCSQTLLPCFPCRAPGSLGPAPNSLDSLDCLDRGPLCDSPSSWAPWPRAGTAALRP